MADRKGRKGQKKGRPSSPRGRSSKSKARGLVTWRSDDDDEDDRKYMTARGKKAQKKMVHHWRDDRLSNLFQPVRNKQPERMAFDQVRAARKDQEFIRQHLRLGEGCRQNECDRNREDDPFCLCRLETCRVSTFFADDGNRSTDEQPRNRGVPAGLHNLANTCYMNSYLQTLFHLLPIRRTMYQWKIPHPEERVAGNRYDVATALRNLFIRLQSTQNRAVDPSDFVRAAGVNTAKQQDAQEFSLLFLNWLDHVIAEKPGEEKIQDLFKARMRSTIRCRLCRGASSTETDMHEFSVHADGVSDLMTGLVILLGEEVIENYLCEVCDSRGVANMEKQLIKLPQLLNINFNRVIFDKKTMTQRKLSHAIEFPMTLDLRSVLTDYKAREWGTAGCLYELKAVLIHLGEAGGGHYFARIRVAKDGEWYTFNDSSVSPYETRADADYRGAYMLVYEKRRDVEVGVRDPSVPDAVADRSLDTMQLAQRLQKLKDTLGGNRVELWMGNIKAKSNGEILWVPTDWLQGLMRELREPSISSLIPPPDMTRFMCNHGRLRGVQGVKAVDKVQMETVFVILDIAPTPFALEGDAFCVDCNRQVMGYDTEEEEEEEEEKDYEWSREDD